VISDDLVTFTLAGMVVVMARLYTVERRLGDPAIDSLPLPNQFNRLSFIQRSGESFDIHCEYI